MNGLSLFAKVSIPRPLRDYYEYSYHPQEMGSLNVGDLVEVPFGRTVLIGCVVEASMTQSQLSDLKLIKPISKKLGPPYSLPQDILDLCLFSSKYYATPLGEVLGYALPPGNFKRVKTKKGSKKDDRLLNDAITKNKELSLLQLNAEQGAVLSAILSAKQGSQFLLEGVTGSGKTEVYIELTKQVLSQNKSALILVPEIALTSQLKERFEKSLGMPIAMWHSAVSDGVRHEQWREVRQGNIRVVIGARSAIFSPLINLGLIVVDEEHDSSYKQEDRFRYQARDLAMYRAHALKATCVLGSATPSLESYHRVQLGKLTKVNLENKFFESEKPIVKIVSLTEQYKNKRDQQGQKSVFHTLTLREMEATLQREEQIMVYYNRRGYAQYVLCKDCGWVKKCKQCSVSMTLYQRKKQLHCHWCGIKELIPEVCENCGSYEVHGMGSGTESLEEDLKNLLPQSKILRLDREVITSQTRLEKVLDEFRSGQANILLGTQMMVKGHDFPRVTLVVVVEADMLFQWPDFRASEKAAQTLIQVAGRSGRAHLQGQVYIQAYDTQHPVLKVVSGEIPWCDFVKEELMLRQELHYPPYGRLIRIRFKDKNQAHLLKLAETVVGQARLALSESSKDNVLGPSEALPPRVQDFFRVDTYFKAKTIQEAQVFLQRVKIMAQQEEIDITVDVDPYGN